MTWWQMFKMMVESAGAPLIIAAAVAAFVAVLWLVL